MTIELKELIETVLIESGQYVGGLESTLLTNDYFRKIVERELRVYSKYRGNRKTREFELYDGKVFQLANQDIDIPDIITKIRYVESTSLFLATSKHGNISDYYWKYQDGVLRFNLPRDRYEVTYTTKYEVTKVDAPEPPDTDPPTPRGDPTYHITGLTEGDDDFMNLVTGRFMQAVGRSRNAFNIPELSLQHDGAALASDGTALYEKAEITLQESKDLHLFVGF